MEPDADAISEAVGLIVEAAKPVRVVLFGSAARGEMRPESDLDFLVVVPDGVNRRATTCLLDRCLANVRRPVEVVVATEEDLRQYGDNFSLVYYPALREGRTVYAA